MNKLLALAIFAMGCGPSSPQAPSGDKPMAEQSTGAVEGLLSQVEKLPEGTKTFELFVPKDLTMKGQPVAQNLAMALVLDKLLGKKLYPDGFEQRPAGRKYKYKSDPPK